MWSLEAFQQHFLERVRNNRPLSQQADTEPADAGLGIYQNNYRTTHSAALNDTFSSVRSLVGDRYFRQLAFGYMAAFHSCSGDLNEYGKNFAEYLQLNLERYPGAEQLPYLVDVAQLDWARQRALFHCESAPSEVLDASAIIGLHPACSLIHSRYPLFAIWQIAQGMDRQIEWDSGPESLAISRSRDGVQVTLLTPAEVLLFQLTEQQLELERVLMRVVTEFPDTNIKTLFAKLNQLGIVASLGRA